MVGCALFLAAAPLAAQETAPVEEAAPESQDEPAVEAYRVWARAEWWVGWIKNATFPPLVTVGPTTVPRPGALDQDGTMIRFGGIVEANERQGARVHVGTWLDDDEAVGIELGYGFLAKRAAYFELTSPGTPVIARPFLNVNTGLQDASLVSYPALASGTVTVRSPTSLHSGDLSVLLALNCSHDYPLHLIAGLRYLRLEDDLDVMETVQVGPGPAAVAGQLIRVHDRYDCDTDFFGAHVGLSGAYRVRRLELLATAKCAIGLGHEIVNTSGTTSFDGPGGPNTLPAGLLVAGNGGRQVHDTFAVVPEVDLQARFEVTRHLVISAGYSFLYWNQVARSGQQVDLRVNPDLVPTSATFGNPTGPAPRSAVQDADFWVHGLHFGVELRF
jgi:hypothetical protein